MTFEHSEPASKTVELLRTMRHDFRSGVALFFEPITLAFQALAYSLQDPPGHHKATLRAIRRRHPTR